MSSGFLLDTNVLSELMRAEPASAVLDWFAKNVQIAMPTGTVNPAEILMGIALLPSGKRRTGLALTAEQLFEQEFAGRCPVFGAAAKNYAVLVAARILLGQPISTEDAQIAAIALASGLTVATCNIGDFENIDGLNLANRWQTSTPH